jgi:DNA-directed RNA polymerase specialized sigma24 family protein
MGGRTRKRGLCRECSARPRCVEACARLEAELDRVSGYQREIPVSDRVIEVLAERAAAVSFPAPDPASIELESETGELTRSGVLALLTRRQARMIELVFWEGLTVAAAAKRLRIDRSAALRRYRNALERLRQWTSPTDLRRDSAED